MKIGISADSVRFIAETSYEVVHILACAQACKVPFEDNEAIFPVEDLAGIKRGCEVLWDHQPALAAQHFRSIVKELKRGKKHIGFQNSN